MPCFDNVAGNQMYDDREFFIVEGQGFPSNEEGYEANEDGNDTKLRMLGNDS